MRNTTVDSFMGRVMTIYYSSYRIVRKEFRDKGTENKTEAK